MNQVTGDDCEGENNDDPECRAMFSKVGNVAANRRRTAAQIQAAFRQPSRLTREEQEDLAFARGEKNRLKESLMGRLTANVGDGPVKAALVANLKSKSLVELQLLAEAYSPVQASYAVAAPPWAMPNYQPPHYLGAGGPPAYVGNSGRDPGEDEVLDLPDYSAPQAPGKKK